MQKKCDKPIGHELSQKKRERERDVLKVQHSLTK